MAISPDRTPRPPSFWSIWYVVGVVLVIVILGVLFFRMATAREQHRNYNQIPPAGQGSGEPGQVIAH